MSPALVIFDLDGTLIDSAADLAAAVNALLAGFGGEPLPLAQVRPMIGDGVAMLIARALAARGLEPSDPEAAAREFMRHYASMATSRTRAFPGVRAALEALRTDAIALAVCSNKPERITRDILQSLGLAGYFPRVVGGDSLPFRKPDPRVLLAVLEEFAVPPAAALLVGDSEVDAATARAADVRFVLMRHGYHRGPLEAIACVASLEGFAELPALVRALG